MGPLSFTPVNASDGRRYRTEGTATIAAMCTTDGVPKGSRTLVNPAELPVIPFVLVA